MSEKRKLLKKKILKELYFQQHLSYTELADKIEKSLPLTMTYVNELIDEGSIQEMGYASSTGGRRPQIFSLKEAHLYVLAVAMDQLVTKMAIFDGHNKQIGETKKIELPLYHNTEALQQLSDELKKFIRASKIPKAKIAGIGIGMPGFINPEKGTNHTFFYLSPQVSISDQLQNDLGVPVMIDNDSSLIALAECKWGLARDKKNAMVINVGWGVGLGMIINGDLFRGHTGFAGEFSHIALFNNNKLCQCGKYGCLETETSLMVVSEKAIRGVEDGKLTAITIPPGDNREALASEIMREARRGDRFAIEVISEAGMNIGRGVAILIHLLNPELVIISGIGSQAGKVWLASIQQGINEHSIPKLAEATELKVSELGAQAELIGAAALVMENFDKTHPAKTGVLENY